MASGAFNYLEGALTIIDVSNPASSVKLAEIADGVALAAIQGLNRKLEEQRAENGELKERLAQLEQLVHSLAGQKAGGAR